jgi:hypothetical protein
MILSLISDYKHAVCRSDEGAKWRRRGCCEPETRGAGGNIGVARRAPPSRRALLHLHLALRPLPLHLDCPHRCLHLCLHLLPHL